MNFKVVVTTLAAAAAIGLLAVPASAAPKKKAIVYDARGHTVFTSRDEDGRTRTRVIIQKRSYLDPGTETFPGERKENEYALMPGQRATSVLDNTAFGTNQSTLPDSFSLPSRHNPWLEF
jgi:hypothetical protein